MSSSLVRPCASPMAMSAPFTAPQVLPVRATPPPKAHASLSAVSRSTPWRSTNAARTACPQVNPCSNSAAALSSGSRGMASSRPSTVPERTRGRRRRSSPLVAAHRLRGLPRAGHRLLQRGDALLRQRAELRTRGAAHLGLVHRELLHVAFVDGLLEHPVEAARRLRLHAGEGLPLLCRHLGIAWHAGLLRQIGELPSDLGVVLDHLLRLGPELRPGGPFRGEAPEPQLQLVHGERLPHELPVAAGRLSLRARRGFLRESPPRQQQAGTCSPHPSGCPHGSPLENGRSRVRRVTLRNVRGGKWFHGTVRAAPHDGAEGRAGGTFSPVRTLAAADRLDAAANAERVPQRAVAAMPSASARARREARARRGTSAPLASPPGSRSPASARTRGGRSSRGEGRPASPSSAEWPCGRSSSPRCR